LFVNSRSFTDKSSSGPFRSILKRLMDLDLESVIRNWMQETDCAETQTQKMSEQSREARTNVHVEEGAVGYRYVP